MGNKLKTFKVSEEVSDLIADDPIPLQKFLRDCLAYRYGLSDKVPTRVEEDKQALVAQQLPSQTELITTTEAAKRLKVTEIHVRQYLIRKGKLASVKMADNSVWVYKDLRSPAKENKQ